MIGNIHYLFEVDPPETQVRERKSVSQHIVEKNEKRYVFGWDAPLQSFYLQVHNLIEGIDEEERIAVWHGATIGSRLREVDDLVKDAAQWGLHIPYETQVKLYGEQDNGG